MCLWEGGVEESAAAPRLNQAFTSLSLKITRNFNIITYLQTEYFQPICLHAALFPLCLCSGYFYCHGATDHGSCPGSGFIPLSGYSCSHPAEQLSSQH